MTVRSLLDQLDTHSFFGEIAPALDGCPRMNKVRSSNSN